MPRAKCTFVVCKNGEAVYTGDRAEIVISVEIDHIPVKGMKLSLSLGYKPATDWSVIGVGQVVSVIDPDEECDYKSGYSYFLIYIEAIL